MKYSIQNFKLTRLTARVMQAVALTALAVVTAALWIPAAHADAIHIDSARIGCLDIQHAPNLTDLVQRECEGKYSCRYKAPTPKQYRAAGVHAKKRTFCTQAMDITWDCGGAKHFVRVKGNAWKHPPARLECPRPPKSAANTPKGKGKAPRLNAAQMIALSTQPRQLLSVMAKSGSHHAKGDVRTPFTPKADGFRFANTFQNDFIPAFNIRTSGLCGGMVYAALDYFHAHKPIPKQNYRPANGTPLHRFIYNREVHSIESNVPEWANVMRNVGGRRNKSLFMHGLDIRPHGALGRLISHLKQGQPMVIDMKGAEGTGNHQVLAIGYNLGRYRGGPGHQYARDVKIYVYDPNHPYKPGHPAIKTLVPDPQIHEFRYAGGSPDRWRTYFVDERYKPKTPPDLYNPTYPNDGKIHELILDIMTGNNDLRGGKHANVNLEVVLANGSRQSYPKINLGARWLPNYTQHVRVVLDHPVTRQQIRKLILTDTSRSGLGHDTWKMADLQVRALINGKLVNIGHAGAKHFRIRDPRLEVPISRVHTAVGQISELVFTFRTGHNALRGNRANLNIEIAYANGTVQREPNVNHGERWPNNSTHQVTIHLDRAVRPQQIRRIVLHTTARPGYHSDVWRLSSVRVMGKGHGVNREIASHGYKRFSVKHSSLAISIAHD